MRLFAAFATSLALLTSLPAAAAPAKAAAPAPAPAAAGPQFDLKNLSVAGWIGGEFGDLDGFALRADASMPVMPLTDKIKLLGVAQLGFTHLGADIPYGSVSWNMLKILAVGRAQMRLAPQIDVFADAGFGFYFGSAKVEVDLPILGSSSTSDSHGGVMLRLAAGGWYELSQQLQVGAELGLNPYFGDADTTNFFISVGAQYKL